jgi:hypothetical protein
MTSYEDLHDERQKILDDLEDELLGTLAYDE